MWLKRWPQMPWWWHLGNVVEEQETSSQYQKSKYRRRHYAWRLTRCMSCQDPAEKCPIQNYKILASKYGRFFGDSVIWHNIWAKTYDKKAKLQLMIFPRRVLPNHLESTQTSEREYTILFSCFERAYSWSFYHLQRLDPIPRNERQHKSQRHEEVANMWI